MEKAMTPEERETNERDLSRPDRDLSRRDFDLSRRDFDLSRRDSDLSRRDLGKLGLAAWSGALAGALLGWRALPAGAAGAAGGDAGAGGGATAAALAAAPKSRKGPETPRIPGTPEPPENNRWLKEPHLCCGLNTCKGKGKGAGNDCAGRGSCAAVAAHGCGGLNDCAGQGPSGDNSCKGKGACAVPLTGSSWKKARASFEEAMTKAGKKFGPPPQGCPAS
jgi:hypothetical protein